MAGSKVQDLSSRKALPLVTHYLGRKVARLQRVWFVHAGEVLGNDGALEITFSDGATLVLDAGADGEALVATNQPWQDPFAEPLLEVNRLWIAEHGKWSARDVSHDASYAKFLGSHLVAFLPMLTSHGTVCGVRLILDRGVIDFVVSGDEAHVFLSAQTASDLAAMNVQHMDEIDAAGPSET